LVQYIRGFVWGHTGKGRWLPPCLVGTEL
jgi:hypothetical protein